MTPLNSSKNSRPPRPPRGDKVRGNKLRHLILYWIDDERKLGRTDGYTITVSTTTIAKRFNARATVIRRVLRRLENERVIAITRRQTPGEGWVTNSITLLPRNVEKRRQVDHLASLIDRTDGQTIMILDRMVKQPVLFEQMTLDRLREVSGYPEPLKLAKALVTAGFVKNNQLFWS